MELLPRCLEWLTEEDIAFAYEAQMHRMAEQGITSICDMALMPHPAATSFATMYMRGSREGKLTLRVHVSHATGRPVASGRPAGSLCGRRVPAAACSWFQAVFDGVSSQHTAWLTEPYANARFEGDCGRPTVPADRMRELVLAAAERGHSVRIHTIGDRAIHEALDIFEEALVWYGAPMQGRNTLEHLENLLPGGYRPPGRFWRAGKLATWAHHPRPGGPERDLGPERSRIMWAIRDVRSAWR